MWIHASEATFLLHAVAITYMRSSLPQSSLKHSDYGDRMEASLSVNVLKDLDWLESELAKNNGGYLVGKTLTAADVMMHYSIQFIFGKRLGMKKLDPAERKGRWTNISAWFEKCEGSNGYKDAVKKTGYTLFP
jgi:glutathione S-transferase